MADHFVAASGPRVSVKITTGVGGMPPVWFVAMRREIQDPSEQKFSSSVCSHPTDATSRTSMTSSASRFNCRCRSDLAAQRP